VSTKGNNYKILPERIYLRPNLGKLSKGEVIFGFISGMFHFFFEPLPSKLTNQFSFFAFFQNIFVLLFLPFVGFGLLIALRYRRQQVMPIFLFLLIIVPLLAISEGNVGTLFRHRDAVVPAFVILGVAGCLAKFKGQKAVLE
jgi:hypothetical protein